MYWERVPKSLYSLYIHIAWLLPRNVDLVLNMCNLIVIYKKESDLFSYIIMYKSGNTSVTHKYKKMALLSYSTSGSI